LAPQLESSGRSAHRHSVFCVQVRQAPLQALAQQRPSTHAIAAQSLASAQGSPGSFFAGGTHRPPAQVSPSGQGRALSSHTPWAVQTWTVKFMAAVHLAAPQTVPSRSRRQLPLPSQPLLQASSRQPPPGSEPPFGTGWQLPKLPSRLQAIHVLLQGWAQQRPCAQMPGATHWSSRLQTAPIGRLPHEPFVQTIPAMQFASLLQRVLQRDPSQPRKGAQLRGSAGSQRPFLQTLAAVPVLLLGSQTPDPQLVPLR
jgi:hypothetical protein